MVFNEVWITTTTLVISSVCQESWHIWDRSRPIDDRDSSLHHTLSQHPVWQKHHSLGVFGLSPSPNRRAVVWQYQPPSAKNPTEIRCQIYLNYMLDFVLNPFSVTFRCLLWERRWSFPIFAWNFKVLFGNACCNGWSNVRILWWVFLSYIFCRRWIVYFPLFSQHSAGCASCTLCSSCLSIFRAYKVVI